MGDMGYLTTMTERQLRNARAASRRLIEMHVSVGNNERLVAEITAELNRRCAIDRTQTRLTAAGSRPFEPPLQTTPEEETHGKTTTHS